MNLLLYGQPPYLLYVRYWVADMVTYQKAKQLLDPGDQVFIIINNQVEAQTIIRIHMDSLSVQDGYLYFDDHGQTWWLTRLVAQENCLGGIRNG